MKRRLTIFIALCLSVCMLATCGAANSRSTEESTAETYEDLFQKDNVIDIHIDRNLRALMLRWTALRWKMLVCAQKEIPA